MFSAVALNIKWLHFKQLTWEAIWLDEEEEQWSCFSHVEMHLWLVLTLFPARLDLTDGLSFHCFQNVLPVPLQMRRHYTSICLGDYWCQSYSLETDYGSMHYSTNSNYVTFKCSFQSCLQSPICHQTRNQKISHEAMTGTHCRRIWPYKNMSQKCFTYKFCSSLFG